MMPADHPGVGPVGDQPSRDWGKLLVAAVLIAIGGYFLLRNTLGLTLPDIPWDRLWPVLVILIGIAALARGWTGRTSRRRHGGRH